MPTTRVHTLLTLPWALLLATAILADAAQSGGSQNSSAAATTTTAAATQDDDDAALQLAEPDFRLINLPTTMRLPVFKGSFDLTHRFAGNLRRGSFSDQASRLFGIDEGATVGFEYRFGLAKHLQAAAYRVSNNRTIQLYAKYDALHQSPSVPLSFSVVLSDEGVNNFQEQYAPAIALSVSRTLSDMVALYLVPTWVHNSAAATGIARDTTFIGVGGRLRVRPTVYLSAEVSPRLSGYAPGKPAFGFAIDKRAGGHMFQLNFTNASGTTLAQVARGGPPKSLALGFNLSRKFF